MFKVDKRTTSKVFLLSMILLISMSINPSSGYLLTNTYTDSNGNLDSFAKFEGKLLLVEAFQTTCPACWDQHAVLTQIYRDFSTEIYMISLSIRAEDTLSVLNQFLIDYPSSWEYGLDDGSVFQNTFGIRFTPTMILFNQEGRKLYQNSEFTSYQDLSGIINSWLSITNPQPGDTIDGYDSGDGSGSLIEDLFGSTLFRISFLSLLVVMVYIKATGPKAVT